MNKHLFITTLLLQGIALGATAQTLTLKGSLIQGGAEQLALTAKAVDGTDSLVTLTANDKTFGGLLPLSATGIYTLYGKKDGAQLVVPFFSPKGQTVCNLTMDIADGFPMLDGSDDNMALSAFNRLTRDKGVYLWKNGRKAEMVSLMPTFIRSYTEAADSLLGVYRCTAETANYLRLWAYTTAYSTCELLPNSLGVSPDDIGFEPTDVLSSPTQVLDTPMSTLFPEAIGIVTRSVPRGGVEERLAWLYDNYTCDTLRSMVKRDIVENYVATFNFAKDYDAGLATLEKVTEQYNLSPNYVKEFKRRRSSAVGAAFPDGVTLTDTDGKPVNFSKFLGKYVYIDLWASWCNPCVREVPYLQKLEKELNNKNVVFVSISLDKKEQAWRNKMTALNMHGNQLLNADNSLAEALNVRGIPRFLIYDKQGKLYNANAPRPSNAALKDLLEKLE